jgi:transcriptional regulator of met regulon
MIKQKWFDKKFEFKYSSADYDSLLNELMKTPEKISQIASSLPEEVLIIKHDDRWSIKENIGHLIDLEELHDGRIDDFIEGKKTLRPADLNNKKTDEANHNDKNISQLLLQLKQVRENFIERLTDLDASVRERVAIHPRLNQPLRPIDMAQFVLEHDEHHIQTIKELIARS